MSSIFYIERNGNRYAYESVSVRVPGKKSPRTIKTYLGKVDPTTGKIIPKKTSKGKVRAASFGSVMLMSEIQRELGIGSDLEDSFGEHSKEILGAAIALAISPTSFSNIPAIEDGTLLRAINGHDTALEKNNVDRMLHYLGGRDDLVKAFFKLRSERNDGRKIIFESDISGHLGRHTVWYENGAQGELPGLMLITDENGIPEGYFKKDRYHVEGYNIQTLGCGSSKDMDMILHRRTKDMDELSDIISSGIRFSAIVDTDSDCLKKLVTIASREMSVQGSDEGLIYREYDVRVSENGAWNVSVNDTDEGIPLKVFVIRDPVKARHEYESMMAHLDEIEGMIRTSSPSDVERMFSKISPSIRRCIDYTISEDASIRPIRRQNAITFARNRAGMHMIVTSPDRTWDTVISDYSTISAFERILGTFDDKDYAIGKSERTWKGMMFVRHLSQILRMHLRRRIMDDTSEKDGAVSGIMTVDSVMMYLSTIYAVNDGDTWICAEHGKTPDRILSRLGHPIPHAGERIDLVSDTVEDD